MANQQLSTLAQANSGLLGSN